MATLRDQYVEALEARGWKRQAVRSHRYLVFSHHRWPSSRVFVGKRGSLRMGRTHKESSPVSDDARRKMLEEE